MQTHRSLTPYTRPTEARGVYDSLMSAAPLSHDQLIARSFLEARLEDAACLECDLPQQTGDLLGWMERSALRTGQRYADYLTARKTGEPRQYFSSRSHALSCLQQLAPTKLVDGAWLSGLLPHWQDDRFYPLIRTYLEELGDGEPDQNHVVLYQRLLTTFGLEQVIELDDEHYLQGAIQLALGCHADAFLPELIGYNLGYEQLPLHLLITAFELDELAIDPYYFTLHVTIDNASTGHARKAVQALLATMPAHADPAVYLERVSRGYRLNNLGPGFADIIEQFDLEASLISMFEQKRIFGQHLHSDFCHIGGRTVNEWLMKSGQMSGFLQALIDNNWVKRHDDPTQSRFWRLIDGSRAPMAGVFSPWEKQLIFDWIGGNWIDCGNNLHSQTDTVGRSSARSHTLNHRSAPGRPACVTRTMTRGSMTPFDEDILGLEKTLASLPVDLRMQQLIRLMSPSCHATAAGLMATRQFAAVLS